MRLGLPIELPPSHAGIRTASPPVAAIGWVSALSLAGTRLLLLAHHLTDVLSGLAMGAAIEGMIAWLTQPRQRPWSA